MGIFGPSKLVIEVANTLRGRVEAACAYIDAENVEGLCSYLEKSNCEINRSRTATGTDVDWAYTDLPFVFHLSGSMFFVEGKEQYFGFLLTKVGDRFSVDAKKEISMAGFPTTREAISLKKVFVSQHGFLDVNKYR